MEEENSHLKRLGADLSLDKHMRGGLAKKFDGLHAVENWPPGFRRHFRSVACRSVGGRNSAAPPSTDGAARQIKPPCGCAFETCLMPGLGVGTCGSGCCYGMRAG